MTETDICNLALGMLGHDRTISGDFRTATTTEAMRCRLFFDASRKKILSAAAWIFAEESVTLGAPIRTRIDESEFDWYYQLPADFLNIVRADPSDYARTAGGLSCNRSDGFRIVYTRDITDLTLWPQCVLDAFSAELAARLSIPMTGGNEEKVRVARSSAVDALAEAKLWNARQTPQPAPARNRYADARR